MKKQILLCALAAAFVVEAAPKLTPVSSRTMLPEAGIVSELRFKAEGDGAVDWVLTRLDGSAFSAGNGAAANGEFTLPVTLPAGYYLFRSGEQCFGVWAAPAFAGEPDAFFGIDAALSWLLARQPERRNELVEILAQNGVRRVRERLWLGDLAPSGDDLEVKDNYREYSALRELYRKNGIEVLDVSHDVPAWLKAGGIPGSPYPQDLRAYAERWSDIAAKYGENWCGLEIWNEPDIGFGAKLPAEFYMPLVKSVAWRFRADGIRVPLVGGVVTERCTVPFRRTMMKSGLLDAIDAISIHHYSTWESMGAMINDYRSLAVEYNRPSMPIWVTECGRSYPENGYYNNISGSRNAALQAALKAVESKAFGAACYFPFVYASYFESSGSFSMWSRDFAPMPELGAYFTVVRQLSGASYVGDFAGCRVFRAADGNALLVAVRGRALSGVEAGVWSGIDGREIPAAEAAAAVEADGMAYCRLPFSAVRGKLNAGTVAMKNFQLGNLRENWTPPPLSPVILAPVGYDSNQHHFLEKEGITLDPAAGKISWSFRAVNLGDEPVEIKLNSANDWNGATEPASWERIIPAEGEVTGEFTAYLPEKPDVSKPFYWTISGASSQGTLLPMATAVNFSAPGLKNSLTGARQIVEPPFLKAESWSRSFSGKGELQVAVTPQQTLLFAAAFEEDGSHWFYPSLTIDETVPQDAALLVRMRSTADAEAHVYAQFTDRDGTIFLSKRLMLCDGLWHKVEITPEMFGCFRAGSKGRKEKINLSEVVKMQFGLSLLRGRKAELEISDLFFYAK